MGLFHGVLFSSSSTLFFWFSSVVISIFIRFAATFVSAVGVPIAVLFFLYILADLYILFDSLSSFEVARVSFYIL